MESEHVTFRTHVSDNCAQSQTAGPGRPQEYSGQVRQTKDAGLSPGLQGRERILCQQKKTASHLSPHLLDLGFWLAGFPRAALFRLEGRKGEEAFERI